MSKNIAAIAPMTNEQVGRIADRFQAFCRKEGAVLLKDTVQAVLEEEGEELSADMFAALRARVERRAKTIRRPVRVNRTLTAAQAIDATNRYKWYIDEQVLAEMPMGGRAEDTAEIFELDYDPTVDQLDREYESRGLRPDPFVAVQVVIDDPAFADERPLAVQWRDSRGRACYAFFDRGVGQREVCVYWVARRWIRGCRFAGVRK